MGKKRVKRTLSVRTGHFFPVITHLKFLRRKVRCTGWRCFNWCRQCIGTASILPFLTIVPKISFINFSCDLDTFPAQYLRCSYIIPPLPGPAYVSPKVKCNKRKSKMTEGRFCVTQQSTLQGSSSRFTLEAIV